MTGGTITGNTAANGGGVYLGAYGSLNMSGGTIGGNTAASVGGGVYKSNSSNGNLNKYGGIIYGKTPAGTPSWNRAGADTKGHAAFVAGAKYRDTDAWSSVNLSSTNTENWNQ